MLPYAVLSMPSGLGYAGLCLVGLVKLPYAGLHMYT